VIGFARENPNHLKTLGSDILLRAALIASLLGGAVPAVAQDVPDGALNNLNLRRGELDRTLEEQKKIRAEIEQLSQERSRLSSELVKTAAQIRQTEVRMTASEQRLADLEESEADLKTRLGSQRGLIAELLAALQRMGRHPPPALLVQPEDALASVRSAIVLGAVLPEIREQAGRLVADLEELGRVRRDAATERNQLAVQRGDQQESLTRLTLLVEVRQKRQEEREKTLAGEGARAAELGREVKSLEELIERMERDVASAKRAAEEASKAAAAATGRRTDLAALSDPGRLAPAMAFGSIRGLLPLPVSGTALRTFGDLDESGTAQKGLTISTRSQAQVTAPCDGWVVYAGPFRSYGQLLILNAGDGYHVLLAGMDKTNVSLGQFVLTGEPIAEMGVASSQIASIVGGGAKQPVLYVEFRKDGQSIDPGPWWASSSEKVRG